MGQPLDELALLRTVIGALGEAIIVTSPELDPPGPRIQYVNPAFTRLTGYASHEVLGQTPRIFQGPDTDRAFLDDLRAALVAGRSFRGEAINYRKDGTEYVVEWLITPVLEDGRVAHWVAVQRDVTELRRSQEQRRRLAAEVNHRVNNNLAAMQSVAAQTARKAETAAEFKDAFQERLRALARVHRLLAGRCWAGIPLGELAEAQVAPHLGGKVGRLQASGPEVSLCPGAAVALGMALSELAANAADHGALSATGGCVHLRWEIEARTDGDRLLLRWAEEGGPPVRPPPGRGFGSRLVERGLPQELQAEARLLFEPSGLRCEIDVPLDTLVGAAR
ncbi:HWE histidine kinase domain-containing protein [Belnapia sp. F-4-1]|uniref:HWE histidine kinase domain-containing protein n=1 Tax=Belnapia sp. F-4-1 TaxID=1545443 RepID=UPI0005B99C44|nr:HWE histidine kinase domain-containing protein [Belnapia sp. F-4-1]